MHQLVLDEILKDCVAYTDHNAPKDILDRWSKEQLAFALIDMVDRLRIAKAALRAELPQPEKHG